MACAHVIVIVGLLAAAHASSHANSNLARLRAVDAGADALLEVAAARSKTFQALAAAIEASDVIVYVASGDALRTDVRGALRFVGRGAGTDRYLRIDLRAGEPGSPSSLTETIATLAHELTHALEVASAAYVTDGVTFADFYKTGAAQLRQDVYDTREALEMGERVHFEMTGRRR